ncbi:hypothetical protein GGR57DRAFT_173512 [Xylariaceae sp. FL1272]|nr:hypothetical protein GGR57DRAFT_173512 [Xylariaceae sp. FL1272]
MAQAGSTRRTACFTTSKPSLSATHASKSLCTISKTAEDGLFMAVLGVWPSLHFEIMSNNLEKADNSVYKNVENCNDGWVARYELWSVKDRTRQRSFQIDLDPTEVLLLLRQSFRQDIKRVDLSAKPGRFSHSRIVLECVETEQRFNASFPLSIAHDCMRFAVLRTIYQLPDNPLTSRTEPTYAVLPLQSLLHYNQKWTTQGLRTYDTLLNYSSAAPKEAKTRNVRTKLGTSI